MKNSILLIVLALFFSMNVTGCSLFSSGDEEQETATVTESEDAADSGDEGEFASDDFESGEDLDFDAEAMAKDEGDDSEEVEELAGEDVEVEDDFGDEYPDDEYGEKGQEAKVAEAGDDAGDSEDDEFGDDDNFDEDYIDDNSFAADDADDAVKDEFEDGDSLEVDEGGGIPETAMTENEEEDLFGQDTMEPVVDTPSFADTTDYGSDAGYDMPSEQSWVPVKKMKPAAYKRAGGNVNRLYVVRSGDNMDSIAEKLYGDSGQADRLYSYNSHFRGKTLNVGDKVYYESPNNKNDPSMMTYYEDNNIGPSYYTSQDGDNIRKVAKKLLGHNNSWMEIYATNESVESKGRLPAGLQLRYWPEGTSAPVMAMNDPEPEPADPIEEPAPITPPPANDPAPMNDPEPVAMDDPEDIPDFEDAEDVKMDDPTEVADINEPEMGDTPDMDKDMNTPPPAVGNVNNNPPPPKPIAPPPPPVANNGIKKPAPPKIGAPGGDDPLAAIGDDSMIMGALGGLLILAAIIMLIFIRRSRAKRVNFSQTQV